jgi:spermidine/putrescine transport system ATP-binding protein
MHIADLADRRPHQLSGGQQQRVALARALVLNPAVLLFDEPLGALDQNLREEMQIELRRVQREVGITFIYVTHDQGEAFGMSDRVIILSRGRIEQDGSPHDLYTKPRSLFVARFTGLRHFLAGEIDSIQGGEVGVTLTGGERLNAKLDDAAQLRQGESVLIGVRPEAVSIGVAGPNRSHVRLTIQSIIYGGKMRRILGRLASGDEFAAEVNASASDDLAEGQTVELSWNARDTLIFKA